MQDAGDRGRLAEIVRRACIAAAIDGYESASMSGLCREGAWEAAVSAIRRLDVAALVERVQTGTRPEDQRRENGS